MAYNSDDEDSFDDDAYSFSDEDSFDDEDYSLSDDKSVQPTNVELRIRCLGVKLKRLYDEYGLEIQYEKDNIAAAKAKYNAAVNIGKYQLVNESTKTCAQSEYKNALSNQKYTYNRILGEMKRELDEFNAYYKSYVLTDYSQAQEYKQLYLYVVESIKSMF